MPNSVSLDIKTFSSSFEGPHILILGRVHGNEPCGTIGAEKMIKALESGQIQLMRGTVTFIPVCNPRAALANTRYIDRNLNRSLRPRLEKDCQAYEDLLANFLCPYLREADVLLDIHSYHVGGEPFVFLGNPEGDELRYAQSLNIPYLVYGFGSGVEENHPDPDHAIGTTEYAREYGALSLTLECGQHDAPSSVQVAYQSIERCLHYFKMIETKDTEYSAPEEPSILLRILTTIFKEKPGYFEKPLTNFEQVKKGQVLAHYDEGGGPLRAEFDGYVVLPKESSELGSEWYYLAKEEELS